MNMQTQPTLGFPSKKKLHLSKEALRTLTGSERLQISAQGRSMRPECLTSTVPTQTIP
jgi:hypothetical protein